MSHFVFICWDGGVGGGKGEGYFTKIETFGLWERATCRSLPLKTHIKVCWCVDRLVEKNKRKLWSFSCLCVHLFSFIKCFLNTVRREYAQYGTHSRGGCLYWILHELFRDWSHFYTQSPIFRASKFIGKFLFKFRFVYINSFSFFDYLKGLDCPGQ